jgi:hypothetical protein
MTYKHIHVLTNLKCYLREFSLLSNKISFYYISFDYSFKDTSKEYRNHNNTQLA